MLNTQELLSDLAPFGEMTVGRSTVSGLVFTSSQTLYSTGLIGITNAGQVEANSEVDLFRSSIGSPGQGWGAAFSLTRSQTNLESADQGRMPANEVFIATHCATSIFKRDGNTGASTEQEDLIQSANLVQALTNSFSIDVTIGDGITRNIGALAAYPQHGGPWGQGPSNDVTVAAVNTGFTRGAQNGCPCPGYVTKLPVPIVFAPNISVAIKVKNGSGVATVPGATSDPGVVANYLAVGDYLAISVALNGYLMTNPT
jgi:hypothetical protein